MRILSLIIAVTVFVVITSCSSTRTRHYEVTLKAGAPVESLSRLRLLSVEPDGTARIEQPSAEQVYVARPHSTTNQVSFWILEDTDPVAQTARLSSTAVISGYWFP